MNLNRLNLDWLSFGGLNSEQILVFLLIGGVAGWLAGLITRGSGIGILGNIVAGVLGAIFGGWMFGVLGISIGRGWVGPLVTATVGAVVILLLVDFIRRR